MDIREKSVAIIGMAGKFPGAPTLAQFWENLCAGVGSLTSFSDAELEAAGIPAAAYNLPRYVRAGSPLSGADLFDATFFGISPREAEILDPQHRLFLECAWEAIENGGYPPRSHAGSTGVFAGTSMNTYYGGVLARNPELLAAVGGYQLMLGNDKDFLPTRVSYKLNLHGPSLGIQTACSTSLVAVQVAYDSLLKHQCDMALAGGASLTFPQKTGYLYQEGMIFSPDGHCRPFDAAGRGIRGGDGVGVVVMKRLADALADGDTIRAVIRGAAVNNDGANKVGYTAPSVDGQAEVIAMAQALAEVEPESIGYIEAHGTGTPLGDPIEVAALTHVFRAQTRRERFCALGSVKGNIGHLDAAAGVAGLIKTVLCLEQKAIPPSLNFESPNPAIDFEHGPFQVQRELAAWPAATTPRRAGVSSFGIGGTNAHVVLEEAPPLPGSSPSTRAQLLILSAKTGPALDAATTALAAHLEQHAELALPDVAYTLQLGREAFPHRRVVVASDSSDAVRALGDVRRVLTSGEAARPRSAVFMFSGQGSQYVNMGDGLYRQDPVFRAELDRCAELFRPHLERDVRSALYGGSAAELEQTSVAQPVLFAVEYALAKMWMSWGVVPAAMIGHSIGEYVAACLAGVLSLDDAVALVAARGSLMQAVPPGSMLSVPLPAAEVSALLNGHDSLAAVNGPALCTVSGPTEKVAAFEALLAGQGVTCRRLHTSHAFHSGMMDPVLPPYRDRVRDVTLRPPQIPFISNVTGTWITDAQAIDPDYWVDHLRRPVQFARGLEELVHDPERVLLEVGPGNALASFARQAGATTPVFSSLPHAKERLDADQFAMTTLGRLWLLGVPVDFAGMQRGAARRRVPLPTYQFDRQRYWVEPSRHAAASQGPVSIVKRPDVGDWFYAPSWSRSAALDAAGRDAESAPGNWLVFLDDVGVGGAIVTRLEAHGSAVTSVRAGSEFQELGPGVYTVDPAAPRQYERLFEALRAADRLPDRLIHLWSVTPASSAVQGLDTLESSQSRGFHSLIAVAQAIGRYASGRPMHLTVVSNGMQAVLADGEVTHPEKATLLGPCMVIPQEYPHIECRSVDVELPVDGAAAERLAARLTREASLERPPGSAAYRAGRRWEQGYEPVRLDPRPGAKLARAGGVYLITGGTGGLGLVCARHLAATPGVTLILTARSAPGPAPQHEVRELETMGARVEVHAADVADAARMHQLVRDIVARHGTIHGVIHAAGTAGGGIIHLKARAPADATLDPKVRGTLILASAVASVPLEFLVLFSSINSIWAGPGGVDYCAANSFLDAFAHSRSGCCATSVIAVNWDTWQEVGMAVNAVVPPELQAAKAYSLENGISPAEGLDALERILAARMPQVVVSTKDLHAVLSYAKLGRMVRRSETAVGLGQTLEAQPDQARHARPDVGTEYVAPRTAEEQHVAAVWSALFGIERVGIHDNFFELGGHSLMATRVLARLEEYAGITLPLETIFDAPTVAQMTERIGTLKWVMDAGPARDESRASREEFEL